MKLRNSVVMELILVVTVFVVGNFLWSTFSGMGKIASRAGTTWYASAAGNGSHLSPAGYWYSS